jgi:nucleoside 2-deoxyribosyltransferase
MDKRYQIFISSTFSDLKEERNKVMQTIMSLDCIPAGMELFPAMDEEQFEFIKRIIDDCDYYLLIVGARYGSMDDNGVSYTEKEYDYAVSKGIPVIAFLHHDISSLPMSKADLDEMLRKKLEQFRKKVETGRLVQYWKNADDLNAKVAVSLPKTIKVFPRTGWVRANLLSNAESLQEMNELRKELAELRAYKTRHEKVQGYAVDIADMDEEFTINVQESQLSTFMEPKGVMSELPLQITHSWMEWFKLIAVKLDEHFHYSGNRDIFHIIISVIQENDNIQNEFLDIESQDLATMKYQFITYGLINEEKHYDEEIWILTKKGKKLLAQLMCVKTKKR